MTTANNPYCKALGIKSPDLEVAKHRPDANYYSLLIVALLERGEPITLQEAAQRFEAAGVAPAESALASLKRCKPGRSPIYRDGDLYALDPHDAEADLWAFRLGLRPPHAPSLRVVRPEAGPLPSVRHRMAVPSTEAVTAMELSRRKAASLTRPSCRPNNRGVESVSSAR